MQLRTRLAYLSLALLVTNVLPAQKAWAGAQEWDKHTRSGADAFRELRYGEAERQFQAAINEAKTFGEHDIRLATSLTNLGVLFNSRGQFDKAEPLFERAVAIKQKSLGAFDVEVVDSAARLCQFYLKRKKYEKADPICQKIIQFGDMQIRDLNNMDSSFKHLDAYYAHHKEMEKAKGLLAQMKQLTQSKSTNNSLELAVLLDQVADSYMERRQGTNKTESERLYKQSLGLREHVLSGNHLALAQSYANLGKLYAEEGRHALAEPLLQRAFSISKETVGAAKPQTYGYLDALSQSTLALGKPAKAEELYRQAQAACEAAYGKSSGQLADINLTLATLLENRGQYREAATLVGDALKIKEKINGPQHASLASILEKYAYLLNKTDRAKEAMKLQSRAKDIKG